MYKLAWKKFILPYAYMLHLYKKFGFYQPKFFNGKDYLPTYQVFHLKLSVSFFVSVYLWVISLYIL